MLKNALLLGLTCLLAAYYLPAQANTPMPVSRSAANPNQTGNSQTLLSSVAAMRHISDDGRYVVIQSSSNNMIAGEVDQNASADIYLYDRQTGAMTLINHLPGQPLTTAGPTSPLTPVTFGAACISRDGNFVIFYTNADNVIAGGTGFVGYNYYLWDRSANTNRLISHIPGSSTTAGSGSAVSFAQISGNGRYVAYLTSATNLVAGQTDTGGNDVFLYDSLTDTNTLVSHQPGSATTACSASAISVDISDDGRYVVWGGTAANAVAGVTDTNSTFDVFLYDRDTGLNTLVSRTGASPSTAGNGQSNLPMISGDGRYVAYVSIATNLVSGQTDANGGYDIFVYDRVTDTNRLVSHASSSLSTAGNGVASAPMTYSHGISKDGRYVVFCTTASDIVAGQSDSNGVADVFLFDNTTNANILVSRTSSSSTATGNGVSNTPMVNADGRYVSFASAATNLVAGMTDANASAQDVFRFDQTSGQNVLASRNQTSATTTGNAGSQYSRISSDGAFVMFASTATDIAQIDTNAQSDLLGVTFAAPPAPEMDVLRGAAVADGATDAVGGTTAGTASVLTYTIANNGNAPLTLSTPVAAPAALSNCTAVITTQPASSVAQSASTALVISLTPTNAGSFSCTLSIANNDADENPYNWTISGSAAAAPVPELDVLRSTLAIANGGTDAAGSLFTAGTGYALNYTLANNGTATLTLGTGSISAQSNCSVVITSAPAGSVAASSATTATLTVTATTPGALSFNFSIANNDANENPYAWSVTGNAGAPPAPEMEVMRGSAIADGGTDSIGAPQSGTPTTLTYTLANVGTATLTLTTPVSVGSLNNCTANVSTQPAASVSPSGGTTLGITVTPSSAGTFSCAVSIANNDANENPYDWTISGNATPPPMPEIHLTRGGVNIFDGGTDTVTGSVAGSASTLTYTIHNQGTANLTLVSPVGNPVAQSNCTATVTAQPGATVSATSNTTMDISLTPTSAGAFSCTMIVSNNDVNENPYNWTISGTATAAPAPEMDVTRGTAIVDGGTSTVVGAVAGTASALTFTILNSGSAPLTLTTPVATPAAQSNCTSIISTQPAASVAASASTSLVISLTPAAAGAFSCTVSIANNDANENPYDWTISGTAAAAPAPEMDVSRGASAVANGSTDNVGTAFTAAVASPLVYTIANSGTANLMLGTPVITSATNCAATVTAAASSPVAASATTNTTITVTPTAAGAFSFNYSLANSDANENPYTWSVNGSASAAPAPEMEVLRGSAPISDGGTDGLGNAMIGVAQTVSYTISNIGTAGLNLTGTPNLVVTAIGANLSSLNVTVQPSASVAAAGTTTFTMTYTIAGAGGFSFTVSINNNDASENPYNWTADGMGSTLPEMDVTRGAAQIVDGLVDTTSGVSGTAEQLLYTINNSGGTDLTLGAATNSNMVNCAVQITQPTTTVAAAASAQLGVMVTPLGAGPFSFEVSIPNNDANENPYNWTVTGMATISGGGNGNGAGGGGGCAAGGNTSFFLMFLAVFGVLFGVRRRAA